MSIAPRGVFVQSKLQMRLASAPEWNGQDENDCMLTWNTKNMSDRNDTRIAEAT